ncbi:hypothetical protein KC717_06280, partial [Candidatus Dojkabacteria bacterium]|nr:hypothetical protein [Candidatus Dojkabacteria bacterium]
IRNVGGVDQLEDLIKLRIADASANEKSEFNPIELQALESRIAEVLKKDMALKVTDLKISGNDLIDLGFSKGKKIGEILNELLEIVTDEPELNERESLLGLSKKLYEETASAECSNFMY